MPEFYSRVLPLIFASSAVQAGDSVRLTLFDDAVWLEERLRTLDAQPDGNNAA